MLTSRGEQVTRGEDSCKAKAEPSGFLVTLRAPDELMLFSKSNFYKPLRTSGSVLAAAPLACGHFESV